VCLYIFFGQIISDTPILLAYIADIYFDFSLTLQNNSPTLSETISLSVLLPITAIFFNLDVLGGFSLSH